MSNCEQGKGNVVPQKESSKFSSVLLEHKEAKTFTKSHLNFYNHAYSSFYEPFSFDGRMNEK